MTEPARRPLAPWWVQIAALALGLTVLLRTAWIGDDAAITLRTVLNFIHGFGPVFNIDERVQGYTHPLWFFLLSALTPLFNSNPFSATFFASISLSLAVLALLCTQVSRHWPRTLVLLAGLLLSRAFVDYSSSGLENPLAHLLLMCLFLCVTAADAAQNRTRLYTAALLCALLYLTRVDLALLAAPLALHMAWQWRGRPRAVLTAAALGLAPVLAWTAFSFFYYGAPFPNTAYAKLGTGIGVAERVVQGGRYFQDSLTRDPLTLGLIAAGCALGLTARHTAHRAAAVGVLLYLAYILYIGGDFMAGRFFTTPLLMSVLVLCRTDALKGPKILLPLAAALLVAGVSKGALHANLMEGRHYKDQQISAAGIADERGFYFPRFSLYQHRKKKITPPWVVYERSLGTTCGGLGYQSIEHGPGRHMIDTCGLVDPLLARLPAIYDPHWRIGHFYRKVPDGYEDSLRQNQNLLHDPGTRAFYEVIRHVTRGPLWSTQRLRAAWQLQTGQAPRPDAHLYRHPPSP